MCGPPTVPRAGPATTGLPAQAARLFFDSAIAPMVELAPGGTLDVQTLDCAGGLIRKTEDLIPHIDDLIDHLGGLNFVTGPISVEGVRPDDVLRVSILDIDPAPTTGEGFIAIAPGFGALVHDNGMGVQVPIKPATTICRVSRNEVAIPLASGEVVLPCRPFVGTIGVAPVLERRMTLSQSPEYVGDID